MKNRKWVFRLNEEGLFSEVDADTYERFLSEEDSKAFPELGGRIIRIAIVHLHFRKARPEKVRAIEFRRCQLTPQGSLDPKFREKRKQLTAELASVRPLPGEEKENVIDAAKRFKERRFQNEFTWSPTVSMVQKLSGLIENRSEGKLRSRDALHQILTLTATA
ncbi:MAG: hypothetical protein GXP58_01335 [Deltaproteobacteria bacterium]|nr:hypothetical protein [Deltaproteobacteria bacterium]